MPDHLPSSSFFEKDAESLRHELRGFPAWSIEAALRFQKSRAGEDFGEAVLGVIAFYLPKTGDRDIRTLPPTTRLREDLGADSLAMTEAAFKLEELFDFSIDTRELVVVETLGDITGHFQRLLKTEE